MKFLNMKWIRLLTPGIVWFILIQSSLVDTPKRQMEKLDRGIVSVRTSPEEVFISWRMLATDPEKTGFNLYRGSRKLNKKTILLTTTYIDKTPVNEEYTVRAVIKGKEQKDGTTCSVWTQNFLRIPLNRPSGGTVKEVIPIPPRFTRPPGRDSINPDNRPFVSPSGFVPEERPADPREYIYTPGDVSVD